MSDEAKSEFSEPSIYRGLQGEDSGKMKLRQNDKLHDLHGRPDIIQILIWISSTRNWEDWG